jgi:Helix-turn-helix domain
VSWRPVKVVAAEAILVRLPSEVVETVAERAVELLAERDVGFLDVTGAAEFLGGWSRKRIYNLVARGAIPYYKPENRLLFDPRELREWVIEDGRERR